MIHAYVTRRVPGRVQRDPARVAQDDFVAVAQKPPWRASTEARGRGHVCIIGSMAGRNTFAGGTCYAGTKHFVMGFAESLLLEVRDAGVAVLVVSEELDELFEICDRIAVIAQGRLSPPRPTGQTNAAEIGMLMSGAFIADGARAAREFSPAGVIGVD